MFAKGVFIKRMLVEGVVVNGVFAKGVLARGVLFLALSRDCDRCTSPSMEITGSVRWTFVHTRVAMT